MAYAAVWSAHGLADTVTLFPVADGTLVDGGVFGPFDGLPDAWDWTFNKSGYEGTITLALSNPGNGLEHRVVWEYDLTTIAMDAPLTARLTFTLRGAPVFPFPDVDVWIFAYPADLVESPDDYLAGPAVAQGHVTVAPFQDPTVFHINVSDVVNEALVDGSDSVAFRFQIDPNAPNPANQAFIDALDAEPTTKPFLTITDGRLGDADGDGVIDLTDYAAFNACLAGPGIPLGPDCAVDDFDFDGDVDLADFQRFERALSDKP
ncbi:MAG: dockerin type I domain-containing protein [Phycisphaerae bacterium]